MARCRHDFAIYVNTAAACTLGHVQGLVSGSKQIRRVQCRVGNADACADGNLLCVDDDGSTNCPNDPLCELFCFCFVAGRTEHRKLIAAEPSDDVLLVDLTGHASCHNLKERVSEEVPVSVVDQLEAIEVDVEHRHARFFRTCPYGLIERHAVRQSSEGTGAR